MKITLVLGLGLALASCASPSTGVAEISTPDGATGLMLSNVPARGVAECMSQILQTAATQSGEEYTITTSGMYPVTYRIHPITDKLNRFTTQVDQLGQRDREPIVSGCALDFGTRNVDLR